MSQTLATAVLQLFPHHTLPRTASHVATRFVPSSPRVNSCDDPHPPYRQNNFLYTPAGFAFLKLEAVH